MTGQSDEVQVHRRFCGPPTSGNGGYVAGLAAEWIEGPAQVDLLAPIPLEIPLHRRRDDADVMLFDELFLHRTGVSDGMTRDRYTIESWFFAPSSYPEAQIPIVF